MAARLPKGEESPPLSPHPVPRVKAEGSWSPPFVSPLANRESVTALSSPDIHISSDRRRESLQAENVHRNTLASPLGLNEGSSPAVSAANEDFYAIPVFARSKENTHDLGSVSYDVPAVKIYRIRDQATLAVYPLDRELLGEVWNTAEQLEEWKLEPLPRAWLDAERKFLPLVEYPLEFLQALLTVLRTQQFTDGAAFSNSVWKKACRRPIPAITVAKTCSSCGVLRKFAARTLLTAPRQFPTWKCAHLGLECNDDVEVTIYTVSPEQWQAAAKPSSAPSRAQSVLPSFAFEQHSQKPPALSPRVSPDVVPASVPRRRPEYFHVATPVHHASLDPREQSHSPFLLSAKPASRTPADPEVRAGTAQRRFDPDAGDDLLSLSDRESNPGQYSPRVPAVEYLTWSQVPLEKRVTNERTSSIMGGRSSALRRATPSHFMVGDPLLHMTESDPSRSQVADFARWMHSSTWRLQRKDLDKWVGTRKSALFEAKGTPMEVTNWDTMMNTFFADNAIINPVIQARLATQTFRGTAANWWRAHSMIVPELVVTYEQLLEWIRTELVPLADPATAVLAWRQLRFLGDVDDYLRQLDQLSTHFPLPHETLLAMATEPLGREALSSVYKADQMHGPTGMPYTRLRKFIHAHLQEMTPSARKHLADAPPMALGYGKSMNDRERRYPTNTAPRRPMQAHMFDLNSREVPEQQHTQAERPPRRYGRGPNPCWVCGSDHHIWSACDKRKRGRCACCGSEAHMTRDCAQRFFPDPQAPRPYYYQNSAPSRPPPPAPNTISG